MAEVTFSQEQFEEWQNLAEKARHIEASKMAKRRATSIVVKAHEAEFDTAYARILKELLA